ncbi:hypothetical protein [Stagnihabitans tardus]|uniref:Uncharacterized protein n=1 Tax=Stagnihabitans tardus TaxID=2699202 RepID=A0AAE4Y859_9RHOB|nr:hypothetical protein [Stagnihabitans tardus]NBZ86636.1 hypothetical protein [Stagnihabitans tardus]
MPDKRHRIALALILAALPGVALAELTDDPDKGNAHDTRVNADIDAVNTRNPKSWLHSASTQDHEVDPWTNELYLGEHCRARPLDQHVEIREDENHGFPGAFTGDFLRSRQELGISGSNCLWSPEIGDWPPPGASDE